MRRLIRLTEAERTKVNAILPFTRSESYRQPRNYFVPS